VIEPRSSAPRKPPGRWCFDKTGTLTEGTLRRVGTLWPLGELAEEECLQLAAALEGQSQHPIAKGVTARAAADRKLKLPAVSEFKNLTGRGAHRRRVDGREVLVVSLGYFARKGARGGRRADRQNSPSREKTVAYSRGRGQGRRGDRARRPWYGPNRAPRWASSRRMGIRCMMLTGDSPRSGEDGRRRARARRLLRRGAAGGEGREDKGGAGGRGLTVSMVGDGGQRRPPRSTQSRSRHRDRWRGPRVAIEFGRRRARAPATPRDVAAIIGLARKTYRKMVQNLAWATGYKRVSRFPLAAAGVAAPVGGSCLRPALWGGVDVGEHGDRSRSTPRLLGRP